MKRIKLIKPLLKKLKRVGYLSYATKIRREAWGTLAMITTNDIILYKDKLSVEQYVILMFWAGGKDQKRIAADLQIPVGTVKSRTHRGMKIIQKIKDSKKQVENASDY